MNIGLITIWVAFLGSAAAALLYLNAARSQSDPRKQQWAYGSFLLALLAICAASVYLFIALFTHQYQLYYVSHYSSNSLPTLYIISAFWAGQEGTFLLWAFFVAVMGIFFLKTSKIVDSYAMMIVSAFLAFLCLLLIVKSPFSLNTPVPADGSGMNPLLQDPWMAIHPPILFLGYAATIFPFALVFSGLLRKDYQHWYALGFAWTVFAALTLGAGIIIGGFWAYEVLGWGGYWGWDPVENSSLVPWLVLLTSIHGLLLQKAKGVLKKTNIFLALSSFVLVLYATFLTRSGVLADFSVHSFTDLGINNYLVGGLVAVLVFGYGTFFLRFRELQSPKINIASLSREVTLLLSLFVLGIAGIFTLIGMSSPILTGLFGKASQVDTSFYNKVNTPVAIAMALLLGVTPFLGWGDEHRTNLLKRLSMPLALTVLACAIAYVAGVTTVALLVFVGSASFGLLSNVIIAFRQYKNGWDTLGGPIAHIGTGLLLIGIIGSGKFDERSTVTLRQGEPQTVQGLQVTFKGIADPNAQKPQMQIDVSDGKQSFLASPKLYFSEYNQSTLREPSIKIFPLHDLYISPVDVKISPLQSAGLQLEIKKGETKSLGGYQIEFEKFEMGEHAQGGGMKVGAVLKVTSKDGEHEITPTLTFNERGEKATMPADLPEFTGPTGAVSKPQVVLSGMNVEEKSILLDITGIGGHMEASGGVQELIVEISTKPLMMVVWTGVVLIIAGTAIALRRRIIAV
ncbi:MAG: cytochrome c biogenesis protein CcsA [Bacteroidota bacterium]